jgi:IS30 family transposase
VTPPHPTPSSGIVSSLAKVAVAFGRSLDTIKKEWRKRDMPGRPGRWDLAEIAQWKATRERDPSDIAGEADEQIKAMRRKKLSLETDIKDLEKTKRARVERSAIGDLLPRKEVEAEVAQALLRIRRGLGAIPRLLFPRLPKELQATLTEELRRLIDQVLSGLVVILQQAQQPEECDAQSAVDAGGPKPRRTKTKPKQKRQVAHKSTPPKAD